MRLLYRILTVVGALGSMAAPAPAQTSHTTMTPKLIKICVNHTGARRELYNESGLVSDPATEIHIYKALYLDPEILTKPYHTIKPDNRLFRDSLELIRYQEMNGTLSCRNNVTYSEADIASLKADLSNYKESGCKESRYITSALETVTKWTTLTKSPTVSEVNRKVDIGGLEYSIHAASKIKLSESVCSKFVDGAMKKLNDIALDPIAPTASGSAARPRNAIRK